MPEVIEIVAVTQLAGHTDRVWHLSWHPTSVTLASCGGDRSIRIWRPDGGAGGEAGNWSCVCVLDDAHKRTIRSVAYSPSGKVIASASFDATTALWEKTESDFECVATLEGHENEVKSVSWSASGSLLATCSRDKSVWIWEAVDDNDFECLSVLQDHTQDVKMIQWHPNEELLASASYDDTIKIWKDDSDDWYCSDTLKGHRSTVWSIDFDSRGERLVSVSDDRSMRIWRRYPSESSDRVDPVWRNVSTKEEHHRRTIFDVSWSKIHGMIATAGADNRLRIASLDDTDSIVDLAEVIEPHGANDVNCIAWCPLEGSSSMLATGGDDGIIRIWRIQKFSDNDS